MKKETIRPILLEELEEAQSLETEIHLKPVAQEGLGWAELAKLMEERRLARLRRAVAELQLWLADRQWEREEIIAAAWTDPLDASRTTKI